MRSTWTRALRLHALDGAARPTLAPGLGAVLMDESRSVVTNVFLDRVRRLAQPKGVLLLEREHSSVH
ncbi:MAG: hypothetical protein CMO32_18045 [Variovorax sp.]|nr:hypothetical protein [Variovorax sp.]